MCPSLLLLFTTVSLPPLPGVDSVLVALLAEKADIQYDSELTDPGKLVAEIESLGFGANLLSDSEGYQQGKVDLIVSTCIPCMYVYIGCIYCEYSMHM